MLVNASSDLVCSLCENFKPKAVDWAKAAARTIIVHAPVRAAWPRKAGHAREKHTFFPQVAMVPVH